MALSEQRETIQDGEMRTETVPRYTFLFTYKVVDRNYMVIKSGKIRCKNQPNEKSAQRDLEALLKKKHPTASKIRFIGPAINETLEQQGDDILALIKRNKARLKKA